MTDPTGRTFVSYRRTRSHEIALVVTALHDHGLPTWRDITNLEAEPTPEELRRVINDPETAAALLWLTEEVQHSDTITKVEIPAILNRKRSNDPFFIQPVAAGGLDYDEAAAVAGGQLGVDDFQRWNIAKLQGNPINDSEAVTVAERLLQRRMREVHRTLSLETPIKLNLQTRETAPFIPGTALSLDWARHFNSRLADSNTWHHRLLPALKIVSTTVRTLANGRRVEAGGLCTLPAAMALGAAFLAPTRTEISWRQSYVKFAEEQIWSLKAARETAEIEIRCSESDLSSADMAVIVTIGPDVEAAIKRSQDMLPNFRGYVRVRGIDGKSIDVHTPGQAVDIVHRAIEAIHKARREWGGIERVHFFLATPTGIAVMLGQLINGLGPVYTYEHDPGNAIGIYHQAAILHPGG